MAAWGCHSGPITTSAARIVIIAGLGTKKVLPYVCNSRINFLTVIDDDDAVEDPIRPGEAALISKLVNPPSYS